MAIQHHPLSNAALGEFDQHVHVDKETIFYYSKGKVTLTCPDNKNFKWVTKMDKDLTEGTNDNPSSNADIMFPEAQHYSKPFGDKPATMHALGVSHALDKQSIDGMDDMGAFADDMMLSALEQAEHTDYKEWTEHQDSLHRSEADEASTKDKDCVKGSFYISPSTDGY